MLVSAAPDFAPSRLSKTTDSADAEPTSPKSQTAAAAQAAIPVRERIGCPQHNKCRLIIVARAIGESQAHYLSVSGCGERWCEEIKGVAKDRQCAFRPPRECIPRGLPPSQRAPCVSPTSNRRGEETVSNHAGHTTLADCLRPHSAKIHDRRGAVSAALLAAKPPMPPFSARP
jgi:hypothetical protein